MRGRLVIASISAAVSGCFFRISSKLACSHNEAVSDISVIHALLSSTLPPFNAICRIA